MNATAIISEIVKSFQILHQGRPFELRCFHAKGQGKIISGIYDDVEKAAADAAQVNQAGYNVYATLNELNLDVFNDTPFNVLRPATQTTKEGNITRRWWLLIDIDTKRPDKDSCSTDSEKAAGRQTAITIRNCLHNEHGWPDPIFADSGNSYHLLYGLGGVEATAEFKQYYRRLLVKLSDQFTTDSVTADKSVFKAAQISKLYGTLVMKAGEPTADRPHRTSRIEYVPPTLTNITLEHIQAVVGTEPQPSKQSAATISDTNGRWNIDALLAEHNIETNKDTNYTDENGQPATRWVLPVCIWNREHTNGACFVIQFASGAVAAGCHHDGCAGKGWVDFKRSLGLPVDPLPQLTFPEPDHGDPGDHDHHGHAAVDHPQLAPAAFHGLLGDIANRIAPYTEASPAAILAHVLVMMGHVIGRRAYVPIGDSRHYLKLYLAVVGRTSIGRKGTALDVASNVFSLAVPAYGLLLHGGLSTGEGLISKVADPVIRTGKDGELVVVNEGVKDKRALFVEAELAAVLQRFRREGNILSQVLRDGWDDKTPSISTKSNPMRATGSHVCLIGHVTPLEIMTALRPIDIAGGLANRFLWFHAVRHQRLPAAPSTPDAVLAPLVTRLQAVLGIDDGPSQIGMTAAAERQWHDEYHRLADEAEAADEQHEGLLARAHAQVRRVAGIYAIADQTLLVNLPHLAAAVAVVDYSRATLRYLFQRYLPTEPPRLLASDPQVMAQRIEEGLRYGPMSRSYITRELFRRNRSAAEVDAAIELLKREGRVVEQHEQSSEGRAIIQYRLPEMS